MSKTIEERAHQYGCKVAGGWYISGMRGMVYDINHESYVEIATEQRQIDIEHACHSFCKVCGYKKDKCDTDWRCEAYGDFRKAMED